MLALRLPSTLTLWPLPSFALTSSVPTVWVLLRSASLKPKSPLAVRLPAFSPGTPSARSVMLPLCTVLSSTGASLRPSMVRVAVVGVMPPLLSTTS